MSVVRAKAENTAISYSQPDAEVLI